jgi:hypothetical protein
MPAAIFERVSSRGSQISRDNQQIELEYMVVGTENDVDVRILVEGTLPSTYTGMPSQNYQIKHLGGGVWEVRATYNRTEVKAAGDSSYSFDTGGQSTKISYSFSTPARGAAGGVVAFAPDYNNAIGVTEDSIEGVEIVTPQHQFSETHYLANALVTTDYKKIMATLTGTMNFAPFKGFEAGEVLFLGASGSKRGVDDWEVTYRFSVSKNNDHVTVGGSLPFFKYGHDYLWVRFHDVVDPTTKRLVKRPQFYYVERVYDWGFFELLGIGV